ncbi:MAG: hypothetical protein WA030_01880 [Candidatus Microsaccharimonas sp.]
MFIPTAVLATIVPTFIDGFMMIALAVLLTLVLVAVALKAISFLKGDTPRYHLFLIWTGMAVDVLAILLFASIGLIYWALNGYADGYLIVKIAFIGIIVGGSIVFAGMMLKFVMRPHPAKKASAPKPVGTEATV